ncbi:MAG: cytochrome c oxidase subunit II [Actinobacteria bacterium]|uniref:cytochrome-c oxidase n=1 Tax=freshwater metagenome TaxID=449393 RepID=A0A6J7SKH3_9ZZZZ|nr:cytochrome c oxidase subunit II [Actinomycetota bacterium]
MTDVELVSAPQEDAQYSWWRRKDVKTIFLIWLLLTVIGLSLCWVPAHLMGESASEQMDETKQTMTLFTAIAAPVGAFIWAVMIYSLAKWRYKGEGPPPDDAPEFRTNTPSVLVWTLGSAILTMVVFVWGLLKIAAIPAASGFGLQGVDAPPAMEIAVTGNQWVWNFTYPEFNDIQSDVLYLPVDTPATFDVTSNDVIHSFWIVQMGVKVDANPGAITHTEVTPHKVGTYEIRCAELCGILHAAMQTQVKVVPKTEFDAWVKAKLAVVPLGPAEPKSEGGA